MQGIKCGSYEYLKAVQVRDGKKLTSIPEQETFAISVEKVGDERLQRKCFSKNWTSRASKETVRNWVKNKCQGSDLQYSLCCISATKERTSKARFDCCVRS